MTSLLAFDGHLPVLGPGVWIAETARVIGQVTLDADVNVWFGAVLRGDVGSIRVGARSNIQDLACLHMTSGVSDVMIGADVTVGHGAIVHGARVGAGVLVGMGSILLDNAEIGAESIIGAGTLITARTQIPPRSLVLGNPGRVVRALSEREYEEGRKGAAGYLELAARYREA